MRNWLYNVLSASPMIALKVEDISRFSIPGPSPIKENFCKNLRYTEFERSDWLKTFRAANQSTRIQSSIKLRCKSGPRRYDFEASIYRAKYSRTWLNLIEKGCCCSSQHLHHRDCSFRLSQKISMKIIKFKSSSIVRVVHIFNFGRLINTKVLSTFNVIC